MVSVAVEAPRSYSPPTTAMAISTMVSVIRAADAAPATKHKTPNTLNGKGKRLRSME